MSDNAEDILASTDISHADRSGYATVIAKFDALFQEQKDLIFERSRGSTGATKKKASPQSNSSSVSKEWATTVPTVT